MNCSKCGKELEENASFCPDCGNQVNPYAAPAAGAPVQINTWLIPAILSAVFCCLPFGIVSSVFAAKANSAVGAGNYPLAQENAAKAKTWFWVAFGVGIVWTVIVTIIQIAVAVGAAAAQNA